MEKRPQANGPSRQGSNVTQKDNQPVESDKKINSANDCDQSGKFSHYTNSRYNNNSRGNWNRSRGKGRGGYNHNRGINNRTIGSNNGANGGGFVQYPQAFYPNVMAPGPMPVDNLAPYNLVPVGFPMAPYYGCDPNCQECQSYYANGVIPQYYTIPTVQYVPLPLGSASPSACDVPVTPSNKLLSPVDSEKGALTSASVPTLYSPLPPQPPPPQAAPFPIVTSVNPPVINEDTCRPASNNNEAIQQWKENSPLSTRDQQQQPLAQLPRPYISGLGSSIHEMNMPGFQRYWLSAVPQGFQMSRPMAPNMVIEHNPLIHSEAESSLLPTQQGLVSPALSLSTSQCPPSQISTSNTGFQVQKS